MSGAHALRFLWRQREFREFVDLRARRVADADYFIGERRGRDVDHAFPAAADEFEAVVSARDHATDQ
jgi:hypothetical protein